MSLSKFAARRRGFTLIELLIVIVVIAILALIVIPKLMGASRQAKESTLKANLHMIRNAVENFKADTGNNPGKLIDLAAATEADVSNKADFPTGSYKGPYLSAQGGVNTDGSGGGPIPANPFITAQTNAEVAGTAAPTATTPTAHWVYDNATGNVWSGVVGATADGAEYGTF